MMFATDLLIYAFAIRNVDVTDGDVTADQSCFSTFLLCFGE